MTNQKTPIASNPSSTLTVYKASAGSGKTFTLAIEYIKLLILNPYAYDGILAVTFTNKATNEMKTRIMSQLYGLWKRHPESRSYMNKITEDLQMSEEMVSAKAKTALHLLLHNYHYFKVQTIDTFFQSVLRNLAHELQLSANLRVSLNDKQVVEEAVDELIDSLAYNAELRTLVKGYMEKQLEDDKSWKIISKIKSFGNTIFSELYKQNRKKMDKIFSEKDFFENFQKKMYAIMNVKQNYIKMGRDVLDEIKKRGLTIDDFSNKASGPVGYFLKLESGLFHDEKCLGKRAEDAMKNADLWCTKSSKKKDEIHDLAVSLLMPRMVAIEKTRERDAILYNSASQTLKHLTDLQLLRQIEEEAHNLNDSSQRFMLSDTQSFLHNMIGDDDSPFIFEKIGSRLEHVMIDEFQDTSTVQWKNFKVLLRECMSQGNSNLIVGDVKQSIYRFRSGDWRLLNDIDKDKDLDQTGVEILPKKENWRSQRNVIAFNNLFLSKLAEYEVNRVEEVSTEKAESIKRAYEDVQQLVPKEHSAQKGLVHIEMLPKDFPESMEERTLQTILTLIKKGVKSRNIAILMRVNKNIPPMAKYIEENSDLKVVSAEAFRLDASAAVRIIINAMRYLTNASDTTALAALTIDYQNAVCHNTDVLTTATIRNNGFIEYLPEAFHNRRDALSAMTLHEMAEELVRIFSLNTLTTESAYMTLLFDCLHNFCNEVSPMLDDFLQSWETEYAQKTIEASDTDGIKILSIHKSKGLEFDHVIIPHCDWKIDPSHANTIWAKSDIEPFLELPMIPLEYTTRNSLANTIFKGYGDEEYIQNEVDNLNLLYVAMTRAGHSLFLIGKREEKAHNVALPICDIIKSLPQELDGLDIHVSGIEDKNQMLCVTYGRIEENTDTLSAEKKEKKESYNPFTTSNSESNSITVNINSFVSKAEFRQSNESRRFADDIIEDADRQRMIRMGTVMHEVFASIKTIDDVEKVLRQMEFDSTLYGEGMTHDILISTIKERFNNATVKDWFSDRWQLYNECSVITPEGELRPDRVMTDGEETIVVDYKFGKRENKHLTQVSTYMDLMRQMGMPNVKGFLWYVKENEVIEVC